jgi:hypothetical protein
VWEQSTSTTEGLKMSADNVSDTFSFLFSDCPTASALALDDAYSPTS